MVYIKIMAPKTASPAPVSKRPSKKAKEAPAESVSESLPCGEESMEESPAAAAPVLEPAPAEEVSAAANVDMDVDADGSPTVESGSSDKLHEIIKLLHKLQRSANKTQRSVNIILQDLEGVDPKNKRVRPKKEPSGFAKPSLLSDEMCDFLDLPHGSKLARTEVTKKLTVYIKQNQLQNPDNRKQILLDDKLKRLLNVDDKTVLTFFTIQKYLSNHKKDSLEASPAVEADPAVKVEA